MTPRLHIAAIRTGLALVMLICGVAMVGPFQGAERAFVPWDKAAHFLAFYGFTSGLFLSFPNRRRVDLALLAALIGAGLEVAQGLTGRDSDVFDMVANAMGAGAVLAPVYLERWRSHLRSPGARRPLNRRRTVLEGAQSPTTGPVEAALDAAASKS